MQIRLWWLATALIALIVHISAHQHGSMWMQIVKLRGNLWNVRRATMQSDRVLRTEITLCGCVWFFRWKYQIPCFIISCTAQKSEKMFNLFLLSTIVQPCLSSSVPCSCAFFILAIFAWHQAALHQVLRLSCKLHGLAAIRNQKIAESEDTSRNYSVYVIGSFAFATDYPALQFQNDDSCNFHDYNIYLDRFLDFVFSAFVSFQCWPSSPKARIIRRICNACNHP